MSIFDFDFFKKRDYSNVVPFPEPKLVPPVEPPAEPPTPTKIFYRFGITDNNKRVAFSMGGMEITMNKVGCQHMIDQITVFMNQLNDEDDE